MSRYLGDLHALLSEAPVTDIETLGDFKKPGGFRKAADKALIAGPGRLEAIKKAWSKTEHDFRLYFANFPGGSKWAEHGLLNDSDIEQIEAKLGTKLPAAVEGAITVIFTNNSGDQWRPMTPWIIAHRVGHVLMRGGRRDESLSHANTEYEQQVFRYLDELSQLHNLKNEHFQKPGKIRDAYSSYAASSNMGQDNRRRAVAHAFGSMRASRARELRNPFEFLHETLAQYLITGKVKLADQHRPVVVNHAWGRAQTRTAQDTDSVETLKRDFAIEIPQYIDNMLDRAKGNVYAM